MESLYLPEELVVRVLLELPVKSLLRVKCVCKSWQGLIESPSFIAQHHATRRESYYLSKGSVGGTRLLISLLSYDTLEVVVPSLDLPYVSPLAPFPKVVPAPCNGVVCIVFGWNDIILWNLATREKKILPKSPLGRPLGQLVPCSRSFGFGYHAKSGDYKVVKISSPEGDELRCEVYSLGSDSWRLLDALVPTKSLSDQLIFTDGKQYWQCAGVSLGNQPIFTDGKLSRQCAGGGEMIMSFDISGESFTTTVMPERDRKAGYSLLPRRLVVLNGSPAIVDSYYIYDGLYKYQIWVPCNKSEAENSDEKTYHWTKLNYEFGPCEELHDFMDGPVDKLVFGRNSSFTDQDLVCYEYDPVNSTFKSPQRAKPIHMVGNAYPYKESLVKFSRLNFNSQ